MTSPMPESYGIKWAGGEYPDGTVSHIPQAEAEIPSAMPPEYQILALRGLSRRRELNEQYDDRLNVLKESAFKSAIERRVAEELTTPHGLVFVDLGNFKKANGPNGSTQEVGDGVLETFVSLFRRKSDVVGRLGGDEFAAFFDLESRNEQRPQTPRQVLRSEVRRITGIRKALVEKYPFLGEGTVQFFVGAGGVVYDSTISYETNRQMANIEMGIEKEKGHTKYGKYRTTDVA